ncbi:MAG TPA: histidine kinase, partial [Tepidiformaceae bacterium]|nr:histidine kinase [Tepidiformaceae bacterium]
MNRRPDDTRPGPEALLDDVALTHHAARGRLRIYLGAAPGAGKTYAMLNEGRRRMRRGTDVVVGYVETYNRPLTMEALEGLEVVPRAKIAYRGVQLEEMDTAALIARAPAVALVDELAHTNAPGSKHEKRYQDVMEILAVGITVISTLNVQHLESLNDVVAGITGIRVRETVPDDVLDSADEVELVDISPEALQARMRHGNIYPLDQAQRALEGFFRHGNLAALRQLALQRVSSEVGQQLTAYMHEHRIEGWEAGGRVLVLLDNTPAAEVAVRRAWRLAHAFETSLIAAYPEALALDGEMVRIVTVARDLNAEVRALAGPIAVAVDELVRDLPIAHVVLLSRQSR